MSLGFLALSYDSPFVGMTKKCNLNLRDYLLILGKLKPTESLIPSALRRPVLIGRGSVVFGQAVPPIVPGMGTIQGFCASTQAEKLLALIASAKKPKQLPMNSTRPL